MTWTLSPGPPSRPAPGGPGESPPYTGLRPSLLPGVAGPGSRFCGQHQGEAQGQQDGWCSLDHASHTARPRGRDLSHVYQKAAPSPSRREPGGFGRSPCPLAFWGMEARLLPLLGIVNTSKECRFNDNSNKMHFVMNNSLPTPVITVRGPLDGQSPRPPGASCRLFHKQSQLVENQPPVQRPRMVCPVAHLSGTRHPAIPPAVGSAWGDLSLAEPDTSAASAPSCEQGSPFLRA